jgi:CRP/FNR family cyclic AMP-dependent transcriptional regulator
MFNKEQLKGEALRRFMMQVASGQALFTQNDKGNTLFIIVEGSIKLVHKVGQTDHVIAIIGPGEIVGEKALVSSTPYRRTFTAIAEVDTTVLEFDSTSLKAIASKLTDFPIKMLEVVVQRLDKANELVAILQVGNAAERTVQYLLYVNRYFSKKNTQGSEFVFKSEEASTVLNLPTSTIDDVVHELVAEKILIQRDRTFTIVDENALTQHLPAIKDKIAA